MLLADTKEKAPTIGRGFFYFKGVFCERDSSGTTEAAKGGEGDGADSPTQAAKGGEAARPNHYTYMKTEIKNWFADLQARICDGLENLDGKAKFITDDWTRAEGGGGRTCVIENGALLAKGGVAYSAVEGAGNAQLLRTLQIPHTEADLEGLQFIATGVSIVLHPISPMVPIIHMNVRYFELSNGFAWFGGGIDLTPHYVIPELAADFHAQLKAVCDKHNPTYYPLFKNWADDYFYIRHRQEMRGIGGIFFDRLNDKYADAPTEKQAAWAFVQDVGNAFVPLYAHQANATRALQYGEAEERWQSIRRSRYVEFNLVWDRGTHFGLQTNGRTESILMSMPPSAQWFYNQQPEAGTKEADTLQYFQKGRDWLG